MQVVFDSGARGVVSLKNDAVRYLEYTGKNASAVGVTLATAGDFSFLSGVMQQLSMEGKNPWKVMTGEDCTAVNALRLSQFCRCTCRGETQMGPLLR